MEDINDTIMVWMSTMDGMSRSLNGCSAGTIFCKMKIHCLLFVVMQKQFVKLTSIKSLQPENQP